MLARSRAWTSGEPYSFPWAITALVRWSAYCLVTGRRSNVDLLTSRYFAIADQPEMSYEEKLGAYLELADEYFETERYRNWCGEHLPHLEERVHEWVGSEELLSHFRGLIGLWLADNTR